MKTLQVVVKITERCNINCNYCYVFNQGNEDYKKHPPQLPLSIIEGLGNFLSTAVKEQNISHVILTFHGGEPLLMKKERFESMCSSLTKKLNGLCEVSLVLQSNGLLIDEDWIKIFSRFKIGVGISLDGTKDYNDLNRIDFSGKGTYDGVIRGMQLLRKAEEQGIIPDFGVLTVPSSEFDGVKVIKHFMEELEIKHFNFLLPIIKHDEEIVDTKKLAKFYCDAFDYWIQNSPEKFEVKIFRNTLIKMLNAGSCDKGVAYDDHLIITVNSQGDLGPDDSLLPLNLDVYKFNIMKDSYTSYIESDLWKNIVSSENTIPDDCLDCGWVNMCRGGSYLGRLVNRYSKDKGFNNPSVICDSLRIFYSHVANTLLKSGVKSSVIEKSLLGGNYRAPA